MHLAPGVKGLDEESISSILDTFMGVSDAKEIKTVEHVQHITAKTLFSMSDEDRKKLYDNIVASVMNDERKTVQ